MLKRNAVILFQGDSITDGNWGRNGDLNHYLGHGYAYLIAARLAADHPEQAWRFINRGCSGHQVGDLHARWKEDAINLAPDMISILIGVNDAGAALASQDKEAGARYEKTYRLMLQETRKALPKVLLVLCDPFVLPVGGVKDRWQEWKTEVDQRRASVRRLAAEFKAVHVRSQEVFDKAAEQTGPEYWMWDGVHPMPAGHELLARAWLEAVKPA